jgi:hypothetical protein
MPLLAGLGACTPTSFTWYGDPADLADYRAAFAAAAGERFVEASAVPDVLARLDGARVLWLGDHHGSARLHHWQRALLGGLLRTGRRVAFVLEAIGEQDEPEVANYLAGRIDERTLRERVRARWPGSWLDDEALDREHYLALLALARSNTVRVYGLEPTPRAPLEQRDEAMAARVRALAQGEPGRIVVVIVGQTHLVGRGDVVSRCGEPALVFGGEPTPELQRAPLPPFGGAGDLLRSDGGLWWFAALLAHGR